MRSRWLSVDKSVIAPQLTYSEAILEGDRQSAEALRLASMESYSRFIESVSVAALARFESFNAILMQDSHGITDTSI